MSTFVDTTAKDVHFVIKRGGETETFELEKVQNSILKAMEAIDRVDEEVAEKVARTVERSLFKYEHITTVTVDEIGDVVENKLMDANQEKNDQLFEIEDLKVKNVSNKNDEIEKLKNV